MRLRINPLARAVATFMAVAGLVTGITYAALSSSATLTNNTINSATASLKVWNGSSFEGTAQGFTVTGLVPSVVTDEYPFYLKNADLPLKVTIQASAPASAAGFDSWSDLSVRFISHDPACPTVSNKVTKTMQELMDAPVELPCNSLPANSQGNDGVLATAGNYGVKFFIDSTEVSGEQVSVGAFTWTLTGTQP